MKKILIFLFGASFLLLNACMREQQVVGPNPSENLTLTLRLESLAGDYGKTRGAENVPSVRNENLVNSLHLLFFNPTTGAYVDYSEITLPEPTEANPDGGTPMNIDGEAVFPEGKVDGAWKILALGNILDDYFIDESVEDWMSRWSGRSYEEVVNAAVGLLPVAIAPDRIPMYGTMDKAAGEEQLHLLMTRIVSRIDVTNEAAGYTLVSATLWNGFPVTSIWGDDDPDYTNEARRINFYGVSGEDAIEDEKIRGGLYTFENIVGALAPEDYYDDKTTCLIIGLQPDGGGATQYYRANLHNNNGQQRLRRNHVYNLVIDAVGGVGQSDEQTAYLGRSNMLVYHIGDWVEATNGLVVSDEYSTLSIPTKTVTMGRDASVAEFKIHTFSTLTSPAPLQIRSQSYRPALNSDGEPSIEARLDGNTLVIESTDLDMDNTPRSGVIVLSYAGLEIAMSVSQSGTHDHFLIVTEPDGGILPFAAFGGIPSGLIRVQASGDWTATLNMTGFSFDSNTAFGAVKKIWTNPDKDADGNVVTGSNANTTLGLITPDETDTTCDKFRVWTFDANMLNNAREAFIVVELDGHEEDYTAIIMLTQNFIKKLLYAPYSASGAPAYDSGDWIEEGGSVTFDGMGNGIVSGYDQWFVQSSRNEDDNSYQTWTSAKIISGGNDDRSHFTVTEPAHDGSDLSQNIVKVEAVGMNASGRDYEMTLRVQTDQVSYSDIKVIQKSASFELSPGGLLTGKIPYQGGTSETISVVTEGAEGLKWQVKSAADLVITESNARDSRKLVRYGERRNSADNDPPTLELVDESGVALTEQFEFGKEYGTDVKFRVKLPKLYFPNRDIAVTASVTVTVNSEGATTGGMTQRVRVAQNALTAKAFVPVTNATATNRGDIMTGYYCEAYYRRINYINTNYGNGTAIARFAGPFGSQFSFLHRHNGDFDANTAWVNTNAFIDNNDGVFSFIADLEGTGRLTGINNWGRGWTFTAPPNAGYGGTFHSNLFNTKMWEFVANRTGGPILSETISTYGTGIQSLVYHDVVSTVATAIPASAVPFVITGGNAYGMVIDPKDRVIYIGESLYVGDAGVDAANYPTENFWINVAFWIAYSSRYGSGFSDMMIENESAAGGGMPAPWDEWWGANAIEDFNDSYAL